MSSACWMRSLVMTSPLEFFVSSSNQTFGWSVRAVSNSCEHLQKEHPGEIQNRVVYSENGAFATTSAKLGEVYPSTYRTPKSRTMLSKVDSGFRRAMLQRHSLSPFLSARREIRLGSRLVCPAEFD